MLTVALVVMLVVLLRTSKMSLYDMWIDDEGLQFLSEAGQTRNARLGYG